MVRVSKYDTLIASRGGTVVRVLASHQCGPGSIPGHSVMWVEFVVGSLRGFQFFPSSKKTNTAKFQFNPECTDTCLNKFVSVLKVLCG